MPEKKPFRDVVVLLPGILGSVLERDGREVWGISATAVWHAATSFGGSVQDLALTDDDPDRLDSGDVRAPRLLDDVHIIPGLVKIDGYSKIARALGATFDLRANQNFFTFPYDWRRDNRVAAKRLANLSKYWLDAWRRRTNDPGARLILIGHSMGGLVSRYFLEVLGGWRVTRALVTMGTPYRGSLNALDSLANGFKKKLGPVTADLTEMLRTFTSVYQLLPIFPCVDQGDQKLLRLTDAALRPIPGVDAKRVAAARAFHDEIQARVDQNLKDPEYVRNGYRIHPIVGIRQETQLAATLSLMGKIQTYPTYPGYDFDGDGTVPRVSATPIELSEQRREIFAGQVHASIQNSAEVLVQLEGLLSGDAISLGDFRAVREPVRLGLKVDDAYAVGEDVIVTIRAEREVVDHELVLTITRTDTNQLVHTRRLDLGRTREAKATFPPLSNGVYRVAVTPNPSIIPVADVFVVIDPDAPRSAPTAAPALRPGSFVAWNERLLMLDSSTPVPQALRLAASHAAEFIVLTRPFGHLQYAFTPSEMRAALDAAIATSPALDPEQVPAEKLLDLHEDDASLRVAEERLARPMPGDPRRPAAARYLLGTPAHIKAIGVLEVGVARNIHSLRAPLRDPARFLETTPVTADGEESVTRYPSIVPSGSARPGEGLVLNVSLLLERDLETKSDDGVQIAAPRGWTSEVVSVHLASQHLDFPEPTFGRGEIVVYKNGPSKGCTIPATVRQSATQTSEIVVEATFYHRTRLSGHASRTIAVVQATPAAVPAPPTLAAPAEPAAATNATRGAAAIDLLAASPHLTVDIQRWGDGGVSMWRLIVDRDDLGAPGLPKSLRGPGPALGDTQAFLSAELEQLAVTAPGRHLIPFEGFGTLLYEHATPTCFKETYQALRKKHGRDLAIQFITDDPYIPWELMYVPTSDGAFGFLAVEHAVARWPIEREGLLKNEVPAGAIRTVAPTYDRRGLDRLPAAQQEVAFLRSSLGAVDVPATTTAVLELLERCPEAVSILHFAGHGSFGGRNPMASTIMLDDDDLSVRHVDRPAVTLGRQCGSFVVLNACEVGATGLALGAMSGWAHAFANREFGGFLGPLWRVADGAASTLIRELLPDVLEGKKTFAQALRDVRAERYRTSPTFLAYVFFGDVTARRRN